VWEGRVDRYNKDIDHSPGRGFSIYDVLRLKTVREQTSEFVGSTRTISGRTTDTRMDWWDFVAMMIPCSHEGATSVGSPALVFRFLF
jgi:hypothetical protein